MPYTNDDAYTEGWNDAMKEMKGEIDELKYEAEGFKNLVGQRVPADGVVCQLRNNLRLIGNRLGGISGVERLNSVVKVPEYTKEIFEKIDELKKENAELQQERQQKRDGDDQWRKDSIIYHKLATSYEKDIVKLKDEIAGLKELLEQYDKSRDAWMIKCDERHGEIVELKELNDLKDLTITQLQKENEKLTIEASKGKALEEFICNGQGWGDFIEGITVVEDVCKDCYKRDCSCDEEEDSLPFGVMAWIADTEEDLCEFNTIEEGKEYIKNMGDDRDYYDKVVVFDRTGYNAEIDNADTITILYEWEGERMYDWKAGEFCCVDWKFRGKCSVCNEDGRWVALDKDDEGNDEPVMCCYGCDTGIDDEEEE